MELQPMAVAHTAPMATRVSPTTISTVSNRVISQLLRMWRASIVRAVSGHDRLEQFMNRFRGSFGVSSWQWKSLQNSHNQRIRARWIAGFPGVFVQNCLCFENAAPTRLPKAHTYSVHDPQDTWLAS